jgi:hypothetical protein
LILLLELLLIKYLNGKNAIFICPAAKTLVDRLAEHVNQRRDAQIEALVPVGIQCPLGDGGRLGLLAVDGSYRKGIGEPLEESQPDVDQQPPTGERATY